MPTNDTPAPRVVGGEPLCVHCERPQASHFPSWKGPSCILPRGEHLFQVVPALPDGLEAPPLAAEGTPPAWVACECGYPDRSKIHAGCTVPPAPSVPTAAREASEYEDTCDRCGADLQTANDDSGLECAGQCRDRLTDAEAAILLASRRAVPSEARGSDANVSVRTLAVWECPDCLFVMDAAHTDSTDPTHYTCPNCSRGSDAGMTGDTARLDWLGQTVDGFANIDRISSVEGQFNGFASLREAIDFAARLTRSPRPDREPTP